MIAKKNIDGSDDMDSIPDSMRQLIAMQAMDGKPFARHLMGRPGNPMAHYGNGMMLSGDLNGSGKVGESSGASSLYLRANSIQTVIHHFTCRSLSIGTWRRVGQNAMDLVIFYSPDKACITYYINNDSAGYKIEYPFAYIRNITLESGEPTPNASGAPPCPGGLLVELTRPPNFFMDSSGSGGFYQCGDFTEDQQASKVLMHHLGGHPKVLSGQLAKLVSLDAFKVRHNPFEVNAMIASAPVSPTFGIVRPASQPNFNFVRPQPPHVGMYQENHFGISPHLHPGRMNPGHKRQRSRSVPAAIDFSLLHGMPTFNIQQPSPIYAHGPTSFAHGSPYPGAGPIGPNLRIDTSSGYGLDYRHVPMSATATSPSEYASPAFFPAHPAQTPMPTSDLNAFAGPFLSPSPMIDQTQLVRHSMTPLSHMSHPEPMIANHSPPLNGMPRSASADIFATANNDAITADKNMLHDLYNKQLISFDALLAGLPDDDPMQEYKTLRNYGETDEEYMRTKQHLNVPVPPFGLDDDDPMKEFETLGMYDESEQHVDISMPHFGTINPHALNSGPH